jgi:hypothetical protein
MKGTTMRAVLLAFVIAMPATAQAQPAPASPAPQPPEPAAPAAQAPESASAPEPAPEPVPAPAPQPVPALMIDTPPQQPEQTGARNAFLAGAKLGGIMPLTGLSPFVQVGVELGYSLMQRKLAIIVGVDYTQPTTTNEERDPRVMGGSYTWKLVEREIGVQVALVYRLSSLKPVIPYGGIGPRVLFARSKVQDNGAPMISATTEQSTKIGVGIPLGVELPLGPGSGIAELLLQYGTLDHVATGDSHTGAVSLGLGYRFAF